MNLDNQRKNPNEFKKVNKALRLYVSSIDNSNPAILEEEALTYSSFFQDKMLIIKAIRKGLSYNLFSHIKDLTPFTENDWSEYLNVSIRTLQRNKNEAKFYFKPIHSEKIIELAEVTNFGLEVFDSKDQFYAWLNTPSYSLGNLKPSELLKDSYGKELVLAELNRIEHGLFS